MPSKEHNFLTDTLIVDALLFDPRLIKRAQNISISNLVSTVKNYVSSHIDPNNKEASVVALLAPSILRNLGFPILSVILWLAETIFNIDLAAIFSSVANEVKSIISNNGQLNSQDAMSIAENAVTEHAGSEASEEEADQLLKSKSNIKYQSFSLRDAQLFKLAIDTFIIQNPDIDLNNPKFNIKHAASITSILGTRAIKTKVTNGLIFIIGWILKVILGTAGFMVAGDAIHALLGHNKIPNSEENKQTYPASTDTSGQKSHISLEVSPSYAPENFNTSISSWIIPVTPSRIEDTIISWTMEIYPQLKGFPNAIKSMPSFRRTIQIIQTYNAGNTLGFTSMPENFKSRKQVIDTFIPEIERNLSKVPSNLKSKVLGPGI